MSRSTGQHGTDASAAAADRPRAHCLLVGPRAAPHAGGPVEQTGGDHAPGAPFTPPAELLDALRAKHVSVERCADVYDAMAKVVTRERSVRAGDPRQPLVLLAIEPARIPAADELVAAISAFAPLTSCWRYEPGHSPALCAYAPGARLRPEPARAAPEPARRSPTGPDLRLAGDGPEFPPERSGTGAPAAADPPGSNAVPPLDADEPDDQAAAERLLTDEELAMLLDDRPANRR